MADTKLRPWKATDQLREEHQTVQDLFQQYRELGDHVSKFKVFQRIKSEVYTHIEIEEAIFYPAIDRLEVEGAQELVSEAHEEHEIMKVLLVQLSGMTPEDFYFDAKMKVLSDNVERHIQEEEELMFPLFRKLDKDDQEHVAARLRAKRGDLTGY